VPAVFIYVSSLAGMVAVVISAVALLLAAAVLLLYAVFGKIRPGMRRLSEVDNGFRISYTGTTLMLVGLVMPVFGAGIGMMIGAAMAAALVRMPHSDVSRTISSLQVCYNRKAYERLQGKTHREEFPVSTSLWVHPCRRMVF